MPQHAHPTRTERNRHPRPHRTRSRKAIAGALLACAACTAAPAQLQYDWGRTFVHMQHGLYEANVFHGLRMDSQQNTYWFSCVAGDVDMDPGPDTALIPAPIGYTYGDAVIAKFDSSGQLVWARHFNTGSNFFYIADLALDESAGLLAIGGQYKSTQDIDPGPATVNLPSASSLYSGYVALFDTAGNYVSHMNYSVGTLTSARCTALRFLPDHTLLVAGHYYGFLDINPNGTTTLPQGSWEPFLARYSVPFTLVQYFDIDGCEGYIRDLQVLPNGNVAVIGEGTGFAVDFDPGPGTSSTNVSPTTIGAFYAVYDSTLALVWARGHGTTAGDIHGLHICGDANGDVYASGCYTILNHSIPFDMNPTPFVSSYIYYSASQQESGRFLIKFSADGTFQWGRMLQGAAQGMNVFAAGEGVPVAVDGAVVLSHRMANGTTLPLTMGAGGAGLVQYPPCTSEPNSRANYLIAFDAATGGLLWVVRDTLHCEEGDQYGSTLAAGPDGVLMLTGYFTDTLNAAMGLVEDLYADTAAGYHANGYLVRFHLPQLSTPVNGPAAIADPLEGSPIRRRVFDAQGRLVRDERWPYTPTDPPQVRLLPAGIYLVEEHFTSGTRRTQRIFVAP